jgi:peptidoglycan/xylan/chitin deacetylase (PgdA/CDA1 family)
VLNQYGFKTTQCFATSFIEGVADQATTNVLAFYNSGHEVCSHTVTHPQLTTLDEATLQYELQHSKQYLESVIGRSVPNFASPYGDYNEHVNDVIKGLYASHRTVDEGYNSKDNFDPYRLRVQNILVGTTAAQVQAWIAQAQADKTWLILVYHRVVDTARSAEAGYETPGPFDSSLVDFQAQMAAVAQSGIAVKTYQDALTITKT